MTIKSKFPFILLLRLTHWMIVSLTVVEVCFISILDIELVITVM